MGYEVTTVVLNNIIELPFKGKILNLGLNKSSKKSTIFSRLRRFKNLRHFLRNENYSYIIDHRPKNRFWVEVFYATYLYHSLKTIYVFHSASKDLYLTQYPALFGKICNRNVYNIAVSKGIKELLLDANEIKNSRVIYNPFPKFQDLPIDPKLEFFMGKSYILSYGRLVDSVKDYSFLLDAYEASKLYQHPVSLVIMGDGPDLSFLKDKANSSEGKDHIFFISAQKNPKNMIENAKFVTLTSKFEGFPMVIIESLSLGCPIVSLDIQTGPNEVIQNNYNGILIKDRDIQDFSQAMLQMINDKDLRELCAENARKSVAHLTMETIKEQWHEILRYE